MKQYEKSILPRFVFLLFTFSSSRSNSTVWYSTVEEVPFKTQEILFWMGLTIVLEGILWKSTFRTQHINTCGFKEQGFLFEIFQIFFKNQLWCGSLTLNGLNVSFFVSIRRVSRCKEPLDALQGHYCLAP